MCRAFVQESHDVLVDELEKRKLGNVWEEEKLMRKLSQLLI